jgi:hypothetical protein
LVNTLSAIAECHLNSTGKASVKQISFPYEAQDKTSGLCDIKKDKITDCRFKYRMNPFVMCVKNLFFV